jgi:hypothetical protein
MAKTNLVVGSEALPNDRPTIPADERGAPLKFTGSGLTGGYDYSPTALGAAKNAWLQTFVVASQVHPRAWDECEFTWEAAEAHRWTWEGPLWTHPGEPINCSLKLKVDYDAATLTGDLEEFRPGRHYLKVSKVKLEVTRATSGYQAQITRMATRISPVQ